MAENEKEAAPGIDLDAARAARREANGVAPSVRFNGETYELPVEVPFETTKLMIAVSAETDAVRINEMVDGVLGALLGEEGYRKFLASSPAPTLQDVIALIYGLTIEYGVTLGESRASTESSPSSGARPRRTSRRPTASTSGKRSTARAAGASAG